MGWGEFGASGRASPAAELAWPHAAAGVLPAWTGTQFLTSLLVLTESFSRPILLGMHRAQHRPVRSWPLQEARWLWNCSCLPVSPQLLLPTSPTAMWPAWLRAGRALLPAWPDTRPAAALVRPQHWEPQLAVLPSYAALEYVLAVCSSIFYDFFYGILQKSSQNSTIMVWGLPLSWFS